MTDRELMQQALEVAEAAVEGITEAINQYIATYGPKWQPHRLQALYDDLAKANNTITALRERLAQPEQCQCPECKAVPHASDCAVHNEPAYPKGVCNCGAQPAQNLSCKSTQARLAAVWGYVKAQPAKPLTDEQIENILSAAEVPELPAGYRSVELKIARAIEAAHGIGGEA